MNYDKNPLRETQGKGDGARNCHNPKFRKNYDSIKWKKDRKKLIDAFNGPPNQIYNKIIPDKYLKKKKK